MDNTLIEYTFYDLNDNIYSRIHTALDRILKDIKRNRIKDVFFQIICEMIQNAAKANFKEIIRREICLDMENKQEYQDLMRNFKDRLPKDHNLLAVKAKKENLYIKFNAYASENYILHLNVINNRPASSEEMVRLDKKIVESKKYDKIGDFYEDHFDDTEGAGLGTALIDISLRALGFSKYLYRVFNDTQERTIAELVVDLKENDY